MIFENVWLIIENGIKAEEQGEVKNKGTDNEIQSVRGSYSYTGPDGVLYTVTYIADENGFQVCIRIYSKKVKSCINISFPPL